MPIKTVFLPSFLPSIFRYACINLVLLACTNPNQKPLSTVVAGQTLIAVDESFMPVCQAISQAFEGTYPKAKLQTKYTSEGESVRLMLADSVDCIIIGRPLSTSEKEQAKTVNKVIVLTDIVATDAVAFVLNPSNPDSLIAFEQIRMMLSGQISNWAAISQTNQSGKIQVVIDRNNSSNLSYLKSKFGLSDTLLFKNIFAAGSSQNTIDYVVKNKSAIGIIGYSWLSDQDSPNQSSTLNRIKLAAISNPKFGKDSFFQPSQAHIFTGQYPFCRLIYVANAEARVGLASGFIRYMISDKGQRIILKHGLKPAVNINREVRFN